MWRTRRGQPQPGNVERKGEEEEQTPWGRTSERRWQVETKRKT
jgi:hypothetical protein